MAEATKLGIKAKDSVTGFSGTVTGRTEYLHTGPRVLLEAPVGADGAMRGEWFEEVRIQPVE